MRHNILVGILMEAIKISDNIFEKIEDIISDFFLNTPDNKPEIKFNSDLREELRIDELAFIELVVWLENEYELEISDDDIDHFSTAQDIVDYICSRI
jgi:acyl carrier protein